MHVRWSALRGMLVLDDETQESVAVLREPLLDPDSGRILGFFVRTLTGFSSDHFFLSTLDILSIGTKVHVRSVETLSPPDELIRLRKYLQDPRSFLGQKIRIRQSGRTVGTCTDIQFDTRHFQVEWLFPRRFLFVGNSIAARDIIEVTVEAIWIEDPLREGKETIRQEQKEMPASLVPEIAPS